MDRNNKSPSDNTFILKAAFYFSFLENTTKLLSLSFSLFYLLLSKGIFRCFHSPSLWFQKRINTQDGSHLYFLFSSFVLLKCFREVTQKSGKDVDFLLVYLVSNLRMIKSLLGILQRFSYVAHLKHLVYTSSKRVYTIC